jgi:hypothetical protein
MFMNHQSWPTEQNAARPSSSQGALHASIHTPMGIMKNKHGDSVVALDTPENRMAVELRSGVPGSARHAGAMDTSPQF